MRYSQAKLYSQKQLHWSDGPIKILGVFIDPCKQRMLQCNEKDLLKKMENTLNAWTARSLTLIGKILIVNMLIISKCLHRFAVLPTFSNEFFVNAKEKIIEFIWNGRKPKIAYNTLTKQIEKGGLKLIDLRSKEQAIKIGWVRKARQTNELEHKFWPKIINEILPLGIDTFECNIKPKRCKIKHDGRKFCLGRYMESMGQLCTSKNRNC